jgi:DMSO/TMAO reductase YedYZ molybdopterin-dependent catalytic subunit
MRRGNLGDMKMKQGVIRNFAAAILFFAALSISTIAQASDASSFYVGGEVQNPGQIYAKDLLALPTTTQNVTYYGGGSIKTEKFTGALLWDFLQKVGIVVNPNVKNDILRKYVVVTGSDGYKAVFGVGEFAPNFGGDQIIIAYLSNGQVLGSPPYARIVAPGDKQGGCFVSEIVRIEVKSGS